MTRLVVYSTIRVIFVSTKAKAIMTTTTTRYSKEEQKNIADTILAQLGGNKFIAMTGTHNFGYAVNEKGNVYLSMKLRKNESKANYLRVTLNDADTYDLEFLNCRTINWELKTTVVNSFTGYYDDMLQDAFKKVTGFDTHL